ncbi:MAG: cell division topological specificity factor MinE [Gammaproteobacteria bacterium]|nr:MAG: cell division topological specificity factor MinE [Gammaproteobacteria bacterium]
MSFMDFFRANRKKSASVAKGRLQVIIAQQRAEVGGPDYLRVMQEEILAVVKKYVEVDDDAVKVQMEKAGECEVLELNITLPDGHVA